MARRKKKELISTPEVSSEYTLDFLNPAQELAWQSYQKNDLLFMLGVAGTGKTHLATAFAIHDILTKRRSKIILTRPVVESGESLGFLPGDFNEKVLPYMLPMYNCIDKIMGKMPFNRDKIRAAITVVPLAYMRGHTFEDAIFILDEAQNCTHEQLKLAITRLGLGSKMIITGDPDQSDLSMHPAINDVVAKINPIAGVDVMKFTEVNIVRHPLVAKILKKW